MKTLHLYHVGPDELDVFAEVFAVSTLAFPRLTKWVIVVVVSSLVVPAVVGG